MKRCLVAILVGISSLAGCASTPAPSSNEQVVPAGAEDNFYAADGKEFWVEGDSTVTLENTLATADAPTKLARAKQLVMLKNVAISWFLDTYVIDKEDTDTNKSYGGFGALTRFASEQDTDPVAVDNLDYRFHYKVQLAGDPGLIDRIPGMASAAGGGKVFTLQMGKVSNADMARLDYNHEWYRDPSWDAFDPTKLTAAQLDPMQLTITPQIGSSDAYLDYGRLFADGELSIAVHFGWDYWARYDIQNSRDLYGWLVDQGFKSPVDSYEKYDRTSGPLQKTITSNGKPIAVKVWLFHPGDAAHMVPGPDPETDAGGKILEQDMRDSLAHREVILWDGHSGPLYGFALADWNKTLEGDMDDSKLPTAEMPSTYQIVLANGCDTYDLGQAFWLNPAKADRKSLNVITTTSFSNVSTDDSVKRIITALTNQDGGKVVPQKISDLTSGLDDDQGWGFHTMYGVHGIDSNPKYDPFSNPAALCHACATDQDCGADGNRCTNIATGVAAGKRACTFGCIDDSGCPTGYACRAIAENGAITSHQCVPASGTCP